MVFIKPPKVLEKNSFDSWQYIKVCSIESGLRQKGHLSSEVNFIFQKFFFDRNYSVHNQENCLKISNNDDDKITILVLSENTAKEVEFK